MEAEELGEEAESLVGSPDSPYRGLFWKIVFLVWNMMIVQKMTSPKLSIQQFPYIYFQLTMQLNFMLVRGQEVSSAREVGRSPRFKAFELTNPAECSQRDRARAQARFSKMKAQEVSVHLSPESYRPLKLPPPALSSLISHLSNLNSTRAGRNEVFSDL